MTSVTGSQKKQKGVWVLVGVKLTIWWASVRLTGFPYKDIKETNMMLRSSSWIVALADAVCRFLDLPSPRDPVLPTYAPSSPSLSLSPSLSRGPDSPVGFAPDQFLPADRWVTAIESGTGSRSVFVPMGRLRHRSTSQIAAGT